MNDKEYNELSQKCREENALIIGGFLGNPESPLDDMVIDYIENGEPPRPPSRAGEIEDWKEKKVLDVLLDNKNIPLSREYIIETCNVDASHRLFDTIYRLYKDNRIDRIKDGVYKYFIP
jgi:hypothetical protein